MMFLKAAALCREGGSRCRGHRRCTNGCNPSLWRHYTCWGAHLFWAETELWYQVDELVLMLMICCSSAELLVSILLMPMAHHLDMLIHSEVLFLLSNHLLLPHSTLSHWKSIVCWSKERKKTSLFWVRLVSFIYR